MPCCYGSGPWELSLPKAPERLAPWGNRPSATGLGFNQENEPSREGTFHAQWLGRIVGEQFQHSNPSLAATDGVRCNHCFGWVKKERLCLV
jgi:hypothetical protein